MVFVDALRVLVIAWVVVHHAAQPYGPTRGEWPIPGPRDLEWLRPLFPLGAAFGMGLLFFLAGYFIPQAYDRKGAARFMMDRWLRIGLPLVVFVMGLHVPVVYLLESGESTISEFIGGVYDSGLQNAYLHLWFLGHLLLYSVGYVTWRLLIDRRQRPPARTLQVPGHRAIIAFVVALALVTWLVRGWYPIDEWVPLLFIVAAEPAHLPQYVSLFVLGIIAYRGDWLRRWSVRLGAIWLSIGLVTSAAVYVAVMRADDPATDLVEGGGFTWQAMLWSGLEALICAGLVVGMIVVSRRFFRRPSRILAALAAASYAAYVLHVGLVIGLQAGLEDVDFPSAAKFLIVAAGGLVLAFGVGHVSRLIPGLRSLLGTGTGASKSSGRRRSG
jgi:peptidoglycan/LPS O-acetylase OafA/YrhL